MKGHCLQGRWEISRLLVAYLLLRGSEACALLSFLLCIVNVSTKLLKLDTVCSCYVQKVSGFFYGTKFLNMLRTANWLLQPVGDCCNVVDVAEMSRGIVNGP